MAEREELLGSGSAGTVGVAVSGGKAKVVAVGVGAKAKRGEPLLLLQNPWYFLTSLFPAIRAPKVSPPSVLKKWILKGEAHSYETTWVPVASGIMDLRFQRKELLPVPIQRLLMKNSVTF